MDMLVAINDCMADENATLTRTRVSINSDASDLTEGAAAREVPRSSLGAGA
jgi:hypothetical protein